MGRNYSYGMETQEGFKMKIELKGSLSEITIELEKLCNKFNIEQSTTRTRSIDEAIYCTIAERGWKYKINAIKKYRNRVSAGLKEAKDDIEAALMYMEDQGITFNR